MTVMCDSNVAKDLNALGLSTINDVLMEIPYNWRHRAHPQNKKQKHLVERLVIERWIYFSMRQPTMLRVAPLLIGQVRQEELIESADVRRDIFSIWEVLRSWLSLLTRPGWGTLTRTWRGCFHNTTDGGRDYFCPPPPSSELRNYWSDLQNSNCFQ